MVKRTIYIVDDEPKLLRSVALTLRSEGIDPVETLNDGRELFSHLAEQPAAMVLLDLTMPNMDGRQVLARLNVEYPEVPVVILTASNDVDTAVACMREGACDYLVKPVAKDRLISAVGKALEISALREEVNSLRKGLVQPDLRRPDAFHEIVTREPTMLSVFRYLEAVSPTRQPVLITGETGTGKELIARAVHNLSGRAGELVAVNVAGLDDEMFADTLFGHKRGAFTGADRNREGMIHLAGEGTLFLDEIGDLSPNSQVKLLRLLQDGFYHPLGSDQPERLKARVVVATNRPVGSGSDQWMRKDLFFRLRGHHVHLPPLRDRQADLPVLIRHFVVRSAKELKRAAPTTPPELVTLLSNYRFPGNVRELKAMLFDAVARHGRGVMSLQCIREAIGPQLSSLDDEGLASNNGASALQFDGAELPTLKEAESHLIDEALRRSNNNQGIAAQMLGLSRQALNKRLVRKNQIA